MTPASPRREASLFTCPRSLTGGFSFVCCFTAYHGAACDWRVARRCFTITCIAPAQSAAARPDRAGAESPGGCRREAHRVVIAPQRPADRLLLAGLRARRRARPGAQARSAAARRRIPPPAQQRDGAAPRLAASAIRAVEPSARPSAARSRSASGRRSADRGVEAAVARQAPHPSTGKADAPWRRHRARVGRRRGRSIPPARTDESCRRRWDRAPAAVTSRPAMPPQSAPVSTIVFSGRAARIAASSLMLQPSPGVGIARRTPARSALRETSQPDRTAATAAPASAMPRAAPPDRPARSPDASRRRTAPRPPPVRAAAPAPRHRPAHPMRPAGPAAPASGRR